MPRFCRHAAREYHMAGDRESPWEVLRRDSFHGFVHPWVVLLYYEPCAEASTTQPAWVDPMRPARMNGRIAIVEFSEMPLCHCQSGIALALVPSVMVRAAHSVCIKNEPSSVPIRIPPLSASSRPPSLAIWDRLSARVRRLGIAQRPGVTPTLPHAPRTA